LKEALSERAILSEADMGLTPELRALSEIDMVSEAEACKAGTPTLAEGVSETDMLSEADTVFLRLKEALSEIGTNSESDSDLATLRDTRSEKPTLSDSWGETSLAPEGRSEKEMVGSVIPVLLVMVMEVTSLSVPMPSVSDCVLRSDVIMESEKGKLSLTDAERERDVDAESAMPMDSDADASKAGTPMLTEGVSEMAMLSEAEAVLLTLKEGVSERDILSEADAPT
jgi:hypothetical protein